MMYITKNFSFHKVAILNNLLDSLKHWNVKYPIKYRSASIMSTLLW